ncbi:recombinase RmuC [Candidatus Formimonas warabiya]|uniref:Recombinase RmuC n=2 Tax=Formimonas warabiya TaxID=1761012 RepID=A0A3G1KX78_FORW1|nr:recombinase RmuC [Candidatus Formimonas warabiya]
MGEWTMPEILMIALIVLNLVAVILLCLLLLRNPYTYLAQLETSLGNLDRNQEKAERMMQGELAKNREEAALNSKEVRREVSESLKTFGDLFLARMTEIATLQKNQLDLFSTRLTNLTQTNETKLDKMRETVEQKMTHLQEDNNKKLEQMRATVDEKLHATLEKRLGESFKLVSDRLEQVHKGLGEMQSLASGVGDLKKVLTNVKTRGTWGEIQLGNLLEQILTMEQYAQNVATKKGGSERVEFAIKLPGRHDKEQDVWLPIDAKFPQEDYQRLLDAREEANAELAEEAGKLLEARIKGEAKDIKEKYLDPPYTTDFGIMFLPTEGLYAEVLRRPGLCENLQRTYRVVVTGPTTLAALLNSLQMGFRTLAIEKRSSEVWALLGAVKTEFGRFGDILDKTKKKLEEASTTIENAAKKSRTIERKLKQVQELPSAEAVQLLEDEETESAAI